MQKSAAFSQSRARENCTRTIIILAAVIIIIIMDNYPMISYLLQQTLRQLCTDSDWIYAVFWRILPRNYPPPKWDSESSFFDRSKGNKRNWILVWEDGFCDFVACASASCSSSEPNSSNSSQNSSTSGSYNNHIIGDETPYMQPEVFFKMSHEVYNFGEGLIGKVAADSSHKWIYKEPSEGDTNEYTSSWAQSALDPYPRTWEAQFRSGIETIAIVAVKEGVIQLGSLKKTCEDLNFVLFLQRKFNYLQSIPGVFAVHPALTQHASLSRQTVPTVAAPISSWASDEPDQQATRESWPLDRTPHKITAERFNMEIYSSAAPTNDYVTRQLTASVVQQNNKQHASHQLDAPNSVMQASLHALLSRLPSVTCRRT